MTSKEFSRKVLYYAVFNKALSQFLPVDGISSIAFIWKIEVLGIDGECFTDFASDLYRFEDTYFNYFEVKSVSIDRFYYSDFLNQIRYFKSFVSKCSDYQMEVLRSDSRFINILNFISNG